MNLTIWLGIDKIISIEIVKNVGYLNPSLFPYDSSPFLFLKLTTGLREKEGIEAITHITNLNS